MTSLTVQIYLGHTVTFHVCKTKLCVLLHWFSSHYKLPVRKLWTRAVQYKPFFVSFGFASDCVSHTAQSSFLLVLFK